MGQRDSGYARKERDLYETPEWVTHALVPHIITIGPLTWEPAAGSGKMERALRSSPMPFDVVSTDISTGHDFLRCSLIDPDISGIITNPPYGLATEFVEHALKLMEPVSGMVAMLLRTDFDHAKTRSHLFRDCPAFMKKVVLTKRIVWFVDSETGKPKASPSENHAWFIWDWTYEGPPTIAYGP